MAITRRITRDCVRNIARGITEDVGSQNLFIPGNWTTGLWVESPSNTFTISGLHGNETLSQDVSTEGLLYTLSFEVVSLSGGNLRFMIGGAVGPFINSVGLKSVTNVGISGGQDGVRALTDVQAVVKDLSIVLAE